MRYVICWPCQTVSQPDSGKRKYCLVNSALTSVRRAGVKPTEVAFTSLARLAAAAGDGDAAFAAAQKVVAQSLVPRLRSFVPALVAFAAAGQVGARTIGCML